MKQHLQKIRAAVARGASRALNAAASLVPDGMIASGIGGIAYGAWLVYEPAGFIAGGVLLLAGGVLAARKKAP